MSSSTKEAKLAISYLTKTIRAKYSQSGRFDYSGGENFFYPIVGNRRIKFEVTPDGFIEAYEGYTDKSGGLHGGKIIEFQDLEKTAIEWLEKEDLE